MRLIVICCLLITACATAPQNIQTRPTSVAPYRQMDCLELSADLQRTNDQLSDLSVRQDRARNTDTSITILGFVIWPVWLALIGTNDYEQEISQLKGEGYAMQEAIKEVCGA